MQKLELRVRKLRQPMKSEKVESSLVVVVGLAASYLTEPERKTTKKLFGLWLPRKWLRW